MSKYLLLLSMFTLTIGCAQEENHLEDDISVDLQDDHIVEPEPEAGESVADDSGSLFRMGDWNTVQHFVSTNTGKVVVIDIWSTYCAPCMKEFPHLIELQQTYGEEIACASFNINYAGLPDQTPETDIEFIEPFLKRHGSSVDHIVSTVTDEKIYAELDIYAIPAVLIYDTNGKLTNKVLEENAYESTIFPRVAEMIGEPTTPGEPNEQ